MRTPAQTGVLHRAPAQYRVPHLRKVDLSESLLATLAEGLQQRKGACSGWIRELRRLSRELGSIAASMKAQAVLLPVPTAEETLFDFVNEDEVKVSAA